MRWLWLFFVTVVAPAACAATALAAEPATLTIRLEDRAGTTIDIGRLTLAPASPGSDALRFDVTLDAPEFVDKFLSMRPFRCLDASGRWLCHLPYPYPKAATIDADDLRNLEYDLLFVEKTPEEYGINAWNGRYFRMSRTAEGFAGELHEVDLNILAAPPEDGVEYPVTVDMLHPADPAVHRFVRVRIAP